MLDNQTYKEGYLLLRIADGDEQAFNIIFQSYHNKLGNYVHRFTKSFTLTQEIVQDVFLRIWLNRAGLKDVDNFSSYLFVITRNHTFNALKKLAREYDKQKKWQSELKEELNLNDDTTIGYNQTLILVNKAIGELPPQQKKVFLLSREKGLTQEQIANELNLSVATVKKHMVLALKFLRSQLGSDVNIILLILSTEFYFS